MSEGRVPTEYNKTRFRFQDIKSNKWFYLTIGVARSSFEDFKKSAETESGIDRELGEKCIDFFVTGQTKGKRPRGVKYVVHWRSPYGPHCVYAQEWLSKEGCHIFKKPGIPVSISYFQEYV